VASWPRAQAPMAAMAGLCDGKPAHGRVRRGKRVLAGLDDAQGCCGAEEESNGAEVGGAR
jgi:hypothetical protein